jgi:hypothetical protein
MPGFLFLTRAGLLELILRPQSQVLVVGITRIGRILECGEADLSDVV